LSNAAFLVKKEKHTSEEARIEKTEQEARTAELSEQDLEQVAGGVSEIEFAGRPSTGQGE